MTFSNLGNNIPEDVAKSFSAALRERFGEFSSPCKRLARLLGISERTARSMFDGNLPATPTFLLALDMLGQKAAA